jgi:hypothetical protein
MISPSKPVDAQLDCPLFKKLPSELSDQIYLLVFTVDTNQDGTIELDQHTKPPWKSLLMTCQRLYSKTHAMYRAAYLRYPTTHTFTIDMNFRPFQPHISRSLSNGILSRINSFRVEWNADEYNKGAPLRFTTTFDRDSRYQDFRTRVRIREGDLYWRGRQMERRAIHTYRHIADAAMLGFKHTCLGYPDICLNAILSRALHKAVRDPEWEQQIWWGF